MNWVVTCSLCGSSYVYESGQGLPEICSSCSEKGKKEVRKFLEKEQKRKEIVAIGSSEFADRKILKTLGLVSHEQVFGMSLVKEMTLEQFNGGTAVSWTEKVRNVRDLVIRFIKDEAIELGGNAVTGVDLAYEVLGMHHDLVMVLVGAKGTAVLVE
jgi:uncharacterized protein YbjQ (UPF0145 family)